MSPKAPTRISCSALSIARTAKTAQSASRAKQTATTALEATAGAGKDAEGER